MTNISELQALKANEEVKKGNEALKLVNNPLFIEALTMIKGDLYSKFMDSKDSSERDEIWRQVKTVDQFENKFRVYVDSGKLALSTLDRLKLKLNIA